MNERTNEYVNETEVDVREGEFEDTYIFVSIVKINGLQSIYRY